MFYYSSGSIIFIPFPPQVLLIGHIPPDGDGYREVYLNITKRHQDVIVGHLFGHTHMDQVHLVSMLAISPHPTHGSM